jgi:FkbM family methyltransferase
VLKEGIPINIPERAINKLRRRLFPLDSFLKQVPGVIHIGANTGQERDHYASLGLNVLWVEPNPTLFEVLRSNISGFPRQNACCYLLAAEHGIEYTFHISNNEGLSSSIFDLALHREIWPDTHFIHDIQITATTLARLIDVEQIDLRRFGALVLDTQGSELLVLRGAVPVLDQFRFVKAEVADFEAYAGCCQLAELTEFMRQHGFALSLKDAFALSRKVPLATTRTGVGTYYEVLYRRL